MRSIYQNDADKRSVSLLGSPDSSLYSSNARMAARRSFLLPIDRPGQVASFSCHCRSGMRYTVRKQKVRRGNDYWYAYRRLYGRIVKRYPGRTADLMLACLELDQLARQAPAMSVVNPSEIAGAAVYLSSNETGFVHGVTLHVDGGRTAISSSYGSGKARRCAI